MLCVYRSAPPPCLRTGQAEVECSTFELRQTVDNRLAFRLADSHPLISYFPSSMVASPPSTPPQTPGVMPH